MSAEPFACIPEWVIIHPDLSDRAVRLYGVIARVADKRTGHAHPCRRTLAEKMHCCTKSVDRAVEELVAVGAITVEEHRREDGSRTSNSYQLHPLSPSTPVSIPLPLDVQAPSTPVSKQGTRVSGSTKNPCSPHPRFDEFWAIYPNKQAKRKAIDAFTAATKRADVDHIIGAAVRYRDFRKAKNEHDFDLLPTSWLNQDRWEDELPRQSIQMSEWGYESV